MKREEEALRRLKEVFRGVLKENLSGLYAHGSLAFGCFCWENSDIDLIGVVREEPTLKEKEELARALLDAERFCPPRGIEMSLTEEKWCRNFRYPTPYCLHYSEKYREECRRDARGFAGRMRGEDFDLAAHFTVIRQKGICLHGKEISEMFGPVPEEDYLDSVRRDAREAADRILEEPVYGILNLCRVSAWLQSGEICSKAEGGRWGAENLPGRYRTMILSALESYREGAQFCGNRENLEEFAAYMAGRIEKT